MSVVSIQFTLNVVRKKGSEAGQADKHKTEAAADVGLRNSLADDARPGTCFVSVLELQLIRLLALRYGVHSGRVHMTNQLAVFGPGTMGHVASHHVTGL